MLEQIRKDLAVVYPQNIVDALLDSFIEIRENYYLGKYEPAELNGGKFVEACVRLLQFELTGSYIPIGQSIRNMVNELRNFEQAPSSFHDSLRLHIPRLLLGIYNIRNRRGVGHLSGDVNPNLADANIITNAANWTLAEIYRMHYAVSLDDAQKTVNNLVERKIPLVYEMGDVKRVLNPKLPAKDQTLVLLYSVYPNGLSDDELLRHTEYSNSSYFRRNILPALHKKRFIYYSEDGSCTILPPGLHYVEENYESWVSKITRR